MLSRKTEDKINGRITSYYWGRGVHLIQPDSQTEKDQGRVWLLQGIPVIIVWASITHFVYDWSGNLAIIGVLTPVNESVWEHLKLAFLPTLLWFFLWYAKTGHNKIGVDARRWFTACAAALLTTPLIILSVHYIFAGAFDIHFLPLDIFSLLLGIVTAQLLAAHVYRYAQLDGWHLYGSLAIIALMAAAFVIFTFDPPHFPLFLDNPTGTYGI